MAWKTVSKCYPNFEKLSFDGNGSVSVDRSIQNKIKNMILEMPRNRFRVVYGGGIIQAEEKNFVAFSGNEVKFEDSPTVRQTYRALYNNPILLPTAEDFRRLRIGGGADYFAAGPVQYTDELGYLRDITLKSKDIRYPLLLASYFPVRNCLIFQDFFSNSEKVDKY